MSKTQLMFDCENAYVSLPASFIDYYMTGCPPVYILVYLYALRCAQGGTGASIQALATRFNILETDVHNAWRHWESVGLVSLTDTSEGLAVTLRTPHLWPSPAAAVPDAIPADAVPAGTTPPAVLPPTAPAPKAAASVIVPLKASFSERPHYNVDELTLFREKSKEVERLFTCAEHALGKLLTYHDMNVLFGFYDWLRLPVDVLQFLLEYCAQNDRRDLRYIEKCALDWADKAIDTPEKARQYVMGFDRDYKAILQAIGSNTGFPSPTQRKYIDKWRGEWQLSTEMILEAVDRAAVQIGKPKFTYVDKILAAWHTAGIHTPEAAKERDTAFIPAKAPAKPSRFANFTQRKNDHSHLEKLQQEYVLRKMKG